MLHCKRLGIGKPLILLHGWGWHSGIWQPLLPFLSNQYEVYLIDLPGFGKSPLPKNYALHTILDLLLEHAPPSATWLGWSLGGMLAWAIGVYSPERVTNLITVASSPRFISDKNWPGVSLEVLNKFSAALQQNSQQTLQDFLDLQLRGSMQAELLKKELYSQIKPASSAALLGGLSLLEQIDLRKNFNKLQCESLHIFGSHDVLVPAGIIDLIQSSLSKGRCKIIKRSGHIPFLSQREVFLNLIK